MGRAGDASASLVTEDVNGRLFDGGQRQGNRVRRPSLNRRHRRSSVHVYRPKDTTGKLRQPDDSLKGHGWRRLIGVLLTIRDQGTTGTPIGFLFELQDDA